MLAFTSFSDAVGFDAPQRDSLSPRARVVEPFFFNPATGWLAGVRHFQDDMASDFKIAINIAAMDQPSWLSCSRGLDSRLEVVQTLLSAVIPRLSFRHQKHLRSQCQSYVGRFVFGRKLSGRPSARSDFGWLSTVSWNDSERWTGAMSPARRCSALSPHL
jgi:hypothetical protein